MYLEPPVVQVDFEVSDDVPSTGEPVGGQKEPTHEDD